MKLITLFALCSSLFAVTSCTTTPDGSKAFLGLTQPQWLGVGQDAAKAAAQGGLIGYSQRRAVVETTSGK